MRFHRAGILANEWLILHGVGATTWHKAVCPANAPMRREFGT